MSILKRQTGRKQQKPPVHIESTAVSESGVQGAALRGGNVSLAEDVLAGVAELRQKDPKIRWQSAAAQERVRNLCNRLEKAGSWMNWKHASVAGGGEIGSLSFALTVTGLSLNMQDDRVLSFLQVLKDADDVFCSSVGVAQLMIMVTVKGVLTS